jgi:2-polyprenyl-3-methyl-5-hydroxy-6-metoxy-1,4-benzoquinol methylase
VSRLGERILLVLSRDPGTPEHVAGTLRTNLDNALDFLKYTVPDFEVRIAGKTVLDFGCGHGWQSLEMARAGAKSVTGVDIRLQDAARNLSHFPTRNVSFLDSLQDGAQFDVTISCSFEHFSDPVQILELMKLHTRPGGVVIVSFAERGSPRTAATCPSSRGCPGSTYSFRNRPC